MYTDAMKRAVRAVPKPPQGFFVDILDNDGFIVVRAKEDVFMALTTAQDKISAVEYMIRVKKALEANGAIVLLMREGGKEQ